MTDPYERDRTGFPRWLKVGGLGALLLALLVGVVLLVTGGNHGPSLHSGSGGAAPVVSMVGVDE